MGSSSQAIRYPVATTVAGNIDALNRVLVDLYTRSNPKDGAALTLRRLVEEEACDLSGEAFARFMDHLYERITTFLDSNEVSENLGALRAICEIIDVTISENASKVAKFSNYMRAAFETKRDPEILVLVITLNLQLSFECKAVVSKYRTQPGLGVDPTGNSLANNRFGPLGVQLLSTSFVSFLLCQVKVALEWLRGERIEYRRFAAVLILKEMAENASTVFNVHVPEFVDAIWVALRYPTLAVQGKAVEALRACLRVIEKHETRYYRMFEATQYGLGRNVPVHSIHGSLLAVGELLRNTGEFMMSRYREVAKIVLRYLEHRDRLVCLSITSLLPRIAHFLRDQFVTNYLMIAPRRGRPSLEALACVGNIAKAMEPTMEPHVRGLLDSMFSSGLSLTLVEALEQITESIPPLLPTIQNRLLEFISTILSRSHHSMPRQSASGHDLLEFAREYVVVYLEDEDGATRKDAVLCCCKLVANSFSVISSTQFSPSRINRASGKQRHWVVEEVAGISLGVLILGCMPGLGPNYQEEEPAMPVAKQIDELALPVAEDISEAKMKSKSRSSTLLRSFRNSITEVNGADSLEKDVEQGSHDLVEAEKVSVVPAEGNEFDSSERNFDQGLTTSNVEVELDESQSFIADNALESMIDNPESIVKEISAVEEAQPLEMMESPIRHDEYNIGAYQILGISSLVPSLLAGIVLYVKRRSDKTLHRVAVSSKKFSTHHVVKEKHSSQNWPTEVDVAGARYPSEMSIFQISSSHSKKYPKSEDDVTGVACPSEMSIFQISSSHRKK
ncbi:hypothetical protein CQW23_29832 [Capsicum baccatum]|uniref:Serine/threonine-protein kinase TOR n=1 Tax=Capsicum baccatum TaxID=33114 RepID=A0A2G2VC23_CAPBA|nr:hypothetical protein CQW23_29832 [Capsicum baccatum]